MLGLNDLLKNSMETLDTIVNSYHNEAGALKNPSDEQQKTIEANVASLDLLGRTFVGAGGTCLVGSYITWGIPYLGPLLGATLTIVGVVSGIVGHDVYRCASNLEPFSAKKTGQKEAKKFNQTDDCEKDAKKKFVKLLCNEASKNTLLGRTAYKAAIANKLL